MGAAKGCRGLLSVVKGGQEIVGGCEALPAVLNSIAEIRGWQGFAKNSKGLVEGRLATSVCQLRRDQIEPGRTESYTGRSTFLLSSGGAGGGH